MPDDEKQSPPAAAPAVAVSATTLPDANSPSRAFMKMFDLDQSAEETGAPIRLVESDPPVIWWVRSDNSKPVRRVRQEIARRNAQKWKRRGFELSVEEQDAIDIEMCARAYVTRWENQPDPDSPGNMLPFSPQNVEAIVTRFAKLRRDVLEAAGSDQTYRRDWLQAVEGN